MKVRRSRPCCTSVSVVRAPTVKQEPCLFSTWAKSSADRAGAMIGAMIFPDWRLRPPGPCGGTDHKPRLQAVSAGGLTRNEGTGRSNCGQAVARQRCIPIQTSAWIDCGLMRPVRPIDPIRPVRGIGRITLRRVPSIRQLRMWLVFARQKARDRLARPPASGQAAIAPQDAPAHADREEETNAAAGHGHIDRRV